VNTAVHLVVEQEESKLQDKPIVIVGTGPVGIKALVTLLEKNPAENIVIYGGEPWEPYNRVKLSSFLAGEVGWSDLIESQRIPDINNLVQHHNCKVVKIECEKNIVIDETGREQNYKKLILALGSQPHVPGVEGVGLDSIYTFRDMSDTQHLLARQVKSRKVVVVGGGVLGLEAAKAMSRNNTSVTVVDHSVNLMANQLDDDASEILKEHILSLGIRIFLGSGVKKIHGGTTATAVELRNGNVLECDTVIFSTGIKPNIELAREAKISVGRGIRVNDTMQTSDPDVYAIGECAEHRNIVYGFVAPGFEQAKVAAADINGTKTNYKGSIQATQLKVIGLPVFSMGRTGESESKRIFVEYVYNRPESGTYRKIVVFKNRLVGSISVGKWDALHRIQESVTKERFVWPWQLKRFRSTGDLWPHEQGNNVNRWPPTATVCNCMGVTRGQCSKAINSGCTTVESIMKKTSASTVCGSCKPLLADMLGGSTKAEKISSIKSIFILSLVSGLAALLAMLIPGAIYNSSSETLVQWDVLWRDNRIKQISGYSILSLTIIGLLVSLKKRWKQFTLFSFPVWRYVHILVGLLIVITLFLHTGFRLGDNVNAWLMILFSSLIVVGGVYGVFMSFRHRVDGVLAKQITSYMNWGHLLLFWPVPVLLSFHVIKTYYF